MSNSVDNKSEVESPPSVDLARYLNVGAINLVAILVCVGIWTYRNSLDGPAVLDDGAVISQSLRLAESTGPKWLPRPRQYVKVSVLLNHAVGGDKVRGYHQVNRLIHIINALLLFGIVRLTLLLPSFTGRFTEITANSLAFCIALIWLVHPLQTQAVTYMAQRMESMMATCFLAAVYSFARSETAVRRLPWYFACVLCFVVGVGTKEVIAMLPFVLLLYDRAFLSADFREVFRRRYILYSVMLLPMILFAFWIAPYFSSRVHKMGFGHPWITPWMYARTQAAVIFHYLGLAVWPEKLCLDYCWPILSVGDSLPWVAMMMATLMGSIATWFRNRPAGFLLLSFFLILAPTSSFMPINDLAFEHRMYLPLACVAGLLVFGIFHFLQKALTPRLLCRELATGLCVVTSLVISVPLIWRTVSRNEDYQDPVRIWETALDARPESHRARFNYATALYRDGRHDEAVENIKRSFRSLCEHWPAPEYVSVYFHDIRVALEQDGRQDEFVEFAEQVNADSPGDGTLSMLLSDLHYARQDYSRAMASLKKATAFPAVADRAQLCLPAVEMAAGDIEGCVRRLHDQIMGTPLNIPQINFLSWILAAHPVDAVRNGELAVRLSERVCFDMQARDAVSWGTLASAYAEAGSFEKAIWASKKAMKYCWENSGSGELEKNRQQLIGYRAGIPCRMDDQAAGLVALRTDKATNSSRTEAGNTVTDVGNTGI